MIAVYLISLSALAVMAVYGRYGKTGLAGILRGFHKQLLIVGAGGILAVCLWINGQNGGALVDGYKVIRNESGKGDRQLKLLAAAGDRKEEISLAVTERSYTEKELEELLRAFLPELDRTVLGENKGFDRVESNLCLVSGLDGYPFYVEWESGDYEWIDPGGNIHNEELDGEKTVTLQAAILYGKRRWDYNFSVVVWPRPYSAEEAFMNKLDQAVREEEDRTRENGYLILPDEIDGQAVIWKEKKQDSSTGVFLLGVAAAVLMSAGVKRDERRKEAARKAELEQDYPEIVSKLTLLLGAGLTLQGGIERLSGDYEKKKKRTGKSSYGYEELLLVRHEIESGVTETAAYMNLGHRCGLPEYKKLSTLLVRSLKKGAGSLLMQLENETKYALEEKKAAARRKGEEAGTKLLLPMMIMLMIVMLLIIIPAFGGFSVT